MEKYLIKYIEMCVVVEPDVCVDFFYNKAMQALHVILFKATIIILLLQ